MKIGRFFLPWAFFLFFAPSGCSLLQREASPSTITAPSASAADPQQAKDLLSQAAGNWFYGNGLGSTALQAGAVAAFPPYAVVVLGNAVLAMSGYKPVGISDLLPEEQRNPWESFYNTVTSGPGRFTSAMANQEYRTPELAAEGMARFQPGSQMVEYLNPASDY